MQVAVLDYQTQEHSLNFSHSDNLTSLDSDLFPHTCPELISPQTSSDSSFTEDDNVFSQQTRGLQTLPYSKIQFDTISSSLGTDQPQLFEQGLYPRTNSFSLGKNFSLTCHEKKIFNANLLTPPHS
jgi:hypothetical protein